MQAFHTKLQNFVSDVFRRKIHFLNMWTHQFQRHEDFETLGNDA